jgi:hypothetical protein
LMPALPDAWSGKGFWRPYSPGVLRLSRWCFGKTPMQTFLDAMPMTKEKMIAA